MIVLHGTWKPSTEIQERGNLFLWGESSTSIKRRKGKTLSHPFQASKDDIFTIITALDPEKTSKNLARQESVFITLPSFSNAPQASPDLIREEYNENGNEKVGLSAWKIDGLCIPPEDAVPLLTMLSGFWTENDGYAIGTDFRFWSKVSKFAMELLSEQHFVPGLITYNGQSFARWQYVLNDQDDITRLSLLAGGMPPICRSIQNGFSNSPEELLSDFLNTAVDSCIRRWIPLSDIKTKTTGLSSAWLESLATGEPIKTTTPRLKNLPEELRSWSEPIHEIQRSGFRTCFRLEPPAPEGQCH